MRIKILEQKDNLDYYFTSPYGKGFGKWEDKERPLQKDYSIELDFYEVIKKDHIRLSQSETPKIDILDNNKVMVTGKVIEYDENTMTIDVGEGIICFCIDKDVPREGLYDKYIDIIVDRLALYDEHYY